MCRALSIVAVALSVAACGSPERPDPPRPSVLVVTLDATRADRIGAYGYPLAETPTWDGLAAQGTRYTRAYSASPLTIPSHATLFTGLTPPSHGVRDHGDFVLGDDAITLAERFSDAGYTTAAFTAAFATRRRWGLAQGFHLYHDPLERLPTERDWSAQRRADEVVDDALAALSRVGDGPIFVWVHLYDAHWPYDPPPAFAARHEGRPYDGEIAFADAQAARLLAWWDAHRPDGVVVVTADHGEALGDAGEQTHGLLLHDSTLRVPLIVRGPGMEAGAEVTDPVGHVDVVPTLLGMAGLPLHPGLQGRDLRAGGSGTVYSEALTGQYHLGLAPLHAYTDASGRYTEGSYGAFYPAVGDHVLVTPAPPPERGGPDLTARADRLGRIRAALDEAVVSPAALDAASLEMLAALGYIGGDSAAEAGDVDPRDVVDAVPLAWEARQLLAMGLFGRAQAIVDRLAVRMPGSWGVDLLQAQLLLRRGRLHEAAGVFAALHDRSPSSTLALQLASIDATLGHWPGAEGWYREALALDPRSAAAMGGVVRSVANQGRAAEAEALASTWLAVHPDHPQLALVRAEVLLSWSQLDEALGEGRRALDALPWSPWAHTAVGRILWERGEADPAIERLQDALALSPYDVAVRTRLALYLLEVGRNAEAVRMTAPLTRLLPGDEGVERLYALAREALANERRGMAVTPLPEDLGGLPEPQEEAEVAEAPGAG